MTPHYLAKATAFRRITVRKMMSGTSVEHIRCVCEFIPLRIEQFPKYTLHVFPIYHPLSPHKHTICLKNMSSDGSYEITTIHYPTSRSNARIEIEGQWYTQKHKFWRHHHTQYILPISRETSTRTQQQSLNRPSNQ